MFDDCLIMAGGAGARLWPASSSRLPKQFLSAGEGSFFSMALERAFAVCGENGKVTIITGITHIPHAAAEAAKLKAHEKKRLVIIAEPVGKNTAAAIACAVVHSLFLGSNRKMLVLTSDHIIKPLDAFLKDAESAASAAAQGNLVVFGIPAKHPETGYGYIEAKISDDDKQKTFKVAAFYEKPDFNTAKKYSASKKFFWNSGMFAFTNEFIIQQFCDFAPDVYRPFEKLKKPKNDAYSVMQGVRILNNWAGLKAAYNQTKSISFDVAISEKCKNTVMVKTTFDWIDIGNWDEYIKISSKKETLVFNADSKNCYVDSDIPVALAGVDDLIVVIRAGKNGEPAAVLITKKGQTQKVKDAVEAIKKSGKKEIL